MAAGTGQHGSQEIPVLRPATPRDAEALGRGVVEGVRDYAAFAPPGWRAPTVLDEVESVRRLLPDPGVWCLVAEVGGELVGQVMVLPAARAARPDDDPALGHLRNLFVREDRWGTGVATALHAAAVEAARGRGFTALRLFAAAGQGRARRFYEREGWVARGAPRHDPGPGLEVVEYRLHLRRAPAAASRFGT